MALSVTMSRKSTSYTLLLLACLSLTYSCWITWSSGPAPRITSLHASIFALLSFLFILPSVLIMNGGFIPIHNDTNDTKTQTSSYQTGSRDLREFAIFNHRGSVVYGSELPMRLGIDKK
uniref:Uncharacterized protein n=1 Tax=Timspurckia oligopyrenoides TaxID=708627 RepID=A0A7S1EPR5_9RHOD|mmetsp:Transcript_10528/g.19001  ORF Transcript_10528/g.19001 Transcript_10528/m.19001 type:complete len:119 (+) Transcript_10528:109-465(+)